MTIKKPNYPRPEFVVVSKENQPIKIKEYLKEYNDDLELIRNQEIKIIDLNVFNIELIIGK
ncbi:MAG: hypothetical protein B6I28_06485 [Fusobacteriia bacterium 4572_132]|nr:MAG: hypothetical protein B6I28_06485 [Fusobacteriia bacterium 4572_132]